MSVYGADVLSCGTYQPLLITAVCPFADLLHDQNVRQGQSRTGAETSGFRQAAHHAGRCVERGRQVRGQILAGQGPGRGRQRQTK